MKYHGTVYKLFCNVGRNNAKASCSASWQAEPVVGQDVGGCQPIAHVGVVLGESSVGGQPRADVGIGSGSLNLVSSPNRWTKKRV